MYVIVKQKHLKRLANCYKEEIIEKHYKRATKIITNAKMIIVKYKIANKDGATEVEELEHIAMSELVDMEVMNEWGGTEQDVVKL